MCMCLPHGKFCIKFSKSQLCIGKKQSKNKNELILDLSEDEELNNKNVINIAFQNNQQAGHNRQLSRQLPPVPDLNVDIYSEVQITNEATQIRRAHSVFQPQHNNDLSFLNGYTLSKDKPSRDDSFIDNGYSQILKSNARNNFNSLRKPSKQRPINEQNFQSLGVLSPQSAVPVIPSRQYSDHELLPELINLHPPILPPPLTLSSSALAKQSNSKMNQVATYLTNNSNTKSKRLSQPPTGCPAIYSQINFMGNTTNSNSRPMSSSPKSSSQTDSQLLNTLQSQFNTPPIMRASLGDVHNCCNSQSNSSNCLVDHNHNIACNTVDDDDRTLDDNLDMTYSTDRNNNEKHTKHMLCDQNNSDNAVYSIPFKPNRLKPSTVSSFPSNGGISNARMSQANQLQSNVYELVDEHPVAANYQPPLPPIPTNQNEHHISSCTTRQSPRLPNQQITSTQQHTNTTTATIATTTTSQQQQNAATTANTATTVNTSLAQHNMPIVVVPYLGQDNYITRFNPYAILQYNNTHDIINNENNTHNNPHMDISTDKAYSLYTCGSDLYAEISDAYLSRQYEELSDPKSPENTTGSGGDNSLDRTQNSAGAKQPNTTTTSQPTTVNNNNKQPDANGQSTSPGSIRVLLEIQSFRHMDSDVDVSSSRCGTPMHPSSFYSGSNNANPDNSNHSSFNRFHCAPKAGSERLTGSPISSTTGSGNILKQHPWFQPQHNKASANNSSNNVGGACGGVINSNTNNTRTNSNITGGLLPSMTPVMERSMEGSSLNLHESTSTHNQIEPLPETANEVENLYELLKQSSNNTQSNYRPSSNQLFGYSSNKSNKFIEYSDDFS